MSDFLLKKNSNRTISFSFLIVTCWDLFELWRSHLVSFDFDPFLFDIGVDRQNFWRNSNLGHNRKLDFDLEKFETKLKNRIWDSAKTCKSYRLEARE